MHRFILMTAVSAALVAGCAGTVGYSATVSNDGYGPDLVYAAPGVQVIADYDEPIFFADNFYWRYDGSTWYRSTYYTGGWVYAPPPPAVLRIERPREYVHYRPQGWSGHRAPPRQAPIVRDHREEQPRVEQRGHQPPPQRAAPPPQRAAPPPQRTAPPPRESPPRHDNRPTNDRDHRQSH